MMEFEEDEEEDEEEEEMSLALAGPGPGPTHVKKPPGPIATCKYGECLKNHAVGIGGHAVDGCGEFMPAGSAYVDTLKCAACNCHRNFHRKEILLEPSHHHHQLAIYSDPSRPHYNHPPPHQQVNYQFYPYNHRSSRNSLVHVPKEEGMRMMMTSSSCVKKRFRTKFTEEQKEKMVEFAEKLEWKIQKDDEAAVVDFCNETGLKRRILKVWMHNNKHTIGKRELHKP